MERFYTILKQAYNIIKEEIGPGAIRDQVLQIAIKAINNTTSPNGLVLMLLVFSAYLRIIKYNASLPIII